MNLWLPRFALLLAAPLLVAQACAKGDDSVTSVYENSSLGDPGGAAGFTGEGGSSGGGAAGSAQAGAGHAGTGKGGSAQAGAAGAPCGAGYVLCDGLCTFTSADPKHCGDCGIGCADGVACVQGQCGPGSAGSGQAGAGQAGAGQAGAGQSGNGQSGSGQAGAGQAGSGNAGSGNAGSGQSGNGQSGSGPAGNGGCAPVTCQDLKYTCGPATDGCGQALDCGACASPQICGGTAAHQCGLPCDPFAQNCAEVGAACYPQTGGFKCSTKGKLGAGETCTYANDCAPGNACLTLAMVTSCHAICDPKAAMPGCAAPSTCGKVDETYGICVAP